MTTASGAGENPVPEAVAGFRGRLTGLWGGSGAQHEASRGRGSVSVPAPILVRMRDEDDSLNSDTLTGSRPTDAGSPAFPRLRSTVLDTQDVHGLAEFYRQLLGWEYAPGNGPDDEEADEWRIIRSPLDGRHPRGQMLAFQHADQVPRSTWPDPEVPQQLHLDFTVETVAQLRESRERALALGATLIRDESDHPVEPICVYADRAGHPFCIFAMTW